MVPIAGSYVFIILNLVYCLEFPQKLERTKSEKLKKFKSFNSEPKMITIVSWCSGRKFENHEFVPEEYRYYEKRELDDKN